MIVLINPNSTDAMTIAMVRTALEAGVKLTGWTSLDGPAAIQGPEDGAACISPLLALVSKASEVGAKAIIIGCFDDTGLDAARDIASCPVIGICQAAYHMAVLSGPRFSVVTTLAVSVPVLETNIHAYGFTTQLACVRASGVPVLDLETDPAGTAPAVIGEIKRAVIEDKVNTVVLGCASMVHIPAFFGETGTVRLIDGVTSAAQFAQFLAK
ncbi:Hydantoin racemase [Rhodobacteraceae bacterium IMCC1933]|nr:Hydantoin racemase [Rhodobacteraceae bacterium IMCC1923]MDP4067036.1 Hydantoin racemase [Rhodobacteraceae bacterium IMCC1933]MDP4071897.1 Hydantoin racemase [Rhodobacteraceae bacterium IMCC1909]